MWQAQAAHRVQAGGTLPAEAGPHRVMVEVLLGRLSATWPTLMLRVGYDSDEQRWLISWTDGPTPAQVSALYADAWVSVPVRVHGRRSRPEQRRPWTLLRTTTNACFTVALVRCHLAGAWDQMRTPTGWRHLSAAALVEDGTAAELTLARAVLAAAGIKAADPVPVREADRAGLFAAVEFYTDALLAATS